MVVHFKNGEREIFDYGYDNTNSYLGDYYLREWKESGFVPTKNGKIPYHNVEKVTFTNYKECKCPECDTLVYIKPEVLN